MSLVEYDLSKAQDAVKELVLQGNLCLVLNGKHYDMDDFMGVLFIESSEYIDMCRQHLRGEKVDFSKVFDTVFDQWINYTIEEMTGNEILEVIDRFN